MTCAGPDLNRRTPTGQRPKRCFAALGSRQSGQRTHLKPQIGVFSRVRRFSRLILDRGVSRALPVFQGISPLSFKSNSRHSVLRCSHSLPLLACQRNALLSRRDPPVQIRSRTFGFRIVRLHPRVERGALATMSQPSPATHRWAFSSDS